MRVLIMLVVTFLIGLAAGWTNSFEAVTGLVMLGIVGSAWVGVRWLEARGAETGDFYPEIEQPSSPGREIIVGALLGLVLAGVVRVSFAALRHTAVYGWFVDVAAQKLLEQADALGSRGSWQGVAEILKDPLPAGTTPVSARRIRRRRYDALLHVAALQDDINARCATLREAKLLADTYGFDDAGAASGSAACDDLLRARNVPQGARLELVSMDDDQSGRSVLRLLATDRSGTALGGLGPADFLVVVDGRRVGVTSVRYDPPPNPGRRWVFVLVPSEITAGARLRSAQMMVSFLAGIVRDTDDSELVICRATPTRVAGPARGGEAVLRGAESLYPAGPAAIFDAIWVAADDLQGRRRGGVVLVTAGGDSASLHDLNEVQARLYHEHIPLYVVALASRPIKGDPLPRIAEATGGVYLSVRSGNVGDVRRALGTRIRGEPVYVVTLAERLLGAPVVVFAPREHPRIEAQR
jgi:hypothetical protein